MYTIFKEYRITEGKILETRENTSKIILHNNPDDFLYEAVFRKQIC